jgi:ABC-type uncharacterized transport system involved in gliding motility auxiliary subunit
MIKIGRVVGVCGFVALLSVPLTLFLWDWQFTWVALAKLIFGLVAVGFWLVTNGRGLRETFHGRPVFYGLFAGLSVVVVAAGLVVFNAIFYVRPIQVDLTDEKIFTLSDQTERVLADLQDVVEVRAFYGPKEPEFGLVQNFLERYRYASDKFVYEFVDPVVHIELVEQYKINMSGPRIVMRHREREERVKLTGQDQSGPEEAITAALLKLTQVGSAARICFTTGHGEKALAGDDARQSMSLFVRDLQGEGFQVDSLSLLELAAVPDDCKALVVAGPAVDFAPGEIESVVKYLDAGGKLMLLVGAGESRSLAELVNRYGIQINDDTVLFPQGRSALEVVTDPMRYPQRHPIFARFFQGGRVMLNQLQAVMPMARSVTRRGDVGGMAVTELVSSTANAWAEKGRLVEGVQVTFDEDQDVRGPVPLAVVAQTRSDEPGAPAEGRRLAVFGSSLFVVDLAYRIYPFNRNLAMNTLAWLTHEERKITIRPRFRAASLLRLDESELKFITFFASDILPLLILALGISIWQVRRWA